MLAKLHEVHVTGLNSSPELAFVLRCVCTPNVATFCFEEGEGVGEVGGSELMQALTAHHGAQSIISSVLRSTSTTRSEIEVEFSDDRGDEGMELTIYGPTRNKDGNLHLWTTRHDWQDSTAMLGAELDRYHLPHVRLKLVQQPFRKSIALLARFPALTELEILGPEKTAKAILAALSLPLSVGGDRTLRCPRLVRVRLSGPIDPNAIKEVVTTLKNNRTKFTARADRCTSREEPQDEVEVCLWNDTILGNPHFWTFFNESDIMGPFPILETKIKRSGTLPLAIRYHDLQYRNEEEESSPPFTAFMELMAPLSSRWKSFSFHGPDADLALLLLSLDGRRLSELVELQVLRTTNGPCDLVWQPIDSPVLETLVSEGSFVPWDSQGFKFLKHLKINSVDTTLEALVRVIQACLSLQELILCHILIDDDDAEGQRQFGGWPDESNPVYLPTLQHVELSGPESAAAITCILRCIRAPNVTYLSVDEGLSRAGRAGRTIIEALTVYHGEESMLTSALNKLSDPGKLHVGVGEGAGDPELLSLILKGPGIRHCIRVLIPESHWDEKAALIATQARQANVPIRLYLVDQEPRPWATLLSLLPSTVDLDLDCIYKAPPPIQELLNALTLLSQPVNGNWLCPRLARFHIANKLGESEIAALREAVVALRFSRTQFNAQEAQNGAAETLLAAVRVTVANLEL
ncbi:hypothetical protein FRB90_012373 [Tulasnella sp. 427]|nr:hypothetical protein FRB90_012373 [Tulasnella sp. 427]